MRTLRLLPLLLILATGCAHRTAGELVVRAQQQFAIYQGAANSKVQQAEDERLALEIRLVTMDSAALIRSAKYTPEQTSQKIAAEIMSKVNAYRERLAVWRGTDNSAAIINLELQSVAKYHNNGVTAADVIPAIDAFGNSAPILFQTPAPTPTPEATPNAQ